MACPACVVGLMGTEDLKVDTGSQAVKIALAAGLAAVIALVAYGALKGKK